MAETPLRWARIDEDLMTGARDAAAAALEGRMNSADDSTLIRAGLYLLRRADQAQLRDAITLARKVAGWPSGTAAAS